MSSNTQSLSCVLSSCLDSQQMIFEIWTSRHIIASDSDDDADVEDVAIQEIAKPSKK